MAGKQLPQPGGPVRSGRAAQVWPRGNLPPSVSSKLRDWVWCEAAGEYVEPADPARLLLKPIPPTPEGPE